MTPSGTNRYAIASYFIPEGFDRHPRKLTGAVYLHTGKGETATGATLEVRIYLNDTLKLKEAIPAQPPDAFKNRSRRRVVGADPRSVREECADCTSAATVLEGALAQPDATTFGAVVGKLVAGDRVYVAFRPAALGSSGELWFDYKVELRSAGAATLPAACPVAEAFRVDTTKPLEEDNGWTAYHYPLCAQAMTNRVDLLFVGDSVTAAWGWTGKAVWEKRLMRYHPGNFGISGQGTQDVLWRIAHGELAGAHPKAVVLMLGSNDINWPAADIVAGVKEVVRQLRARFPSSPLLLGGILPRGEQPRTPERLKILEANAQLAKLDDGGHIHYFYFGDKLLLPDGRLPKEIAPDFLHPGECGYQAWVEAIQPMLDQIFPQEVHPNG